MNKELLQQCLDALAPHGSSYGNGKRPVEDAAIEALEQALAQQEVGINGLTYDETSQTASVMGLVNKPQPALSDAEINELAFQHRLVIEGCWSEDAIAFARAIEAHCRGGVNHENTTRTNQ